MGTESCREKKSKQKYRWTRNEWGNYIADKVADDKMHILLDDGLLIQNREIEARTLLQTIPQTGQLYIGDASGTPKALDGVMEHAMAKVLRTQRQNT